MSAATRILAGLLLPGLLFAAPAPGPQEQTLPPGIAQPQDPQAQTPQLPIPEVQNFDPCSVSTTDADRDVCYAAQFQTVSLSLNHIYRGTIVALEREMEDARRRSDNAGLLFDSAVILSLKSAQAAWIKYRDLQCSAAGQQVQGGSIEPMIISRCMTHVTEHRIEEIREAYEIGGRKIE